TAAAWSVAPAAGAATPQATCKPGQTTGCTSVGTGNGAAAPTASASSSCSGGVVVTMSNINGDVAVTYTVTTPDGAHHGVTVPADQILRRTYPVARGVRTPVVVSAPGMATVSRSLPSGCVGSSHVLGQRFVRGSSSSSSTGSAAVAVAPQLPFTGVPVTPALALGAGLVLAGGLLLR